MKEAPSILQQSIERALHAGADDLPVWNIDAALDVSRVRDMLAVIRAACRAADAEAQVTAMPLCWDELEWAHARYASP